MENDYFALALGGGPTKTAAEMTNRFGGLDYFRAFGPATQQVAENTIETSSWSDLFKAQNLGTTLSGIGAVIGGIGGIWNAINQRNYYKDAYNMEKRRIADLKAQHDKTQQTFADVWGE